MAESGGDKEARRTRVRTVCFHLYEFLEQAKFIYSKESWSVVAQCQGWEIDCKRARRNFLGVLEMFYIFIVTVIIQMYAFVKTL